MSTEAASTGFPKGVNHLFVFFFFNFVSCMIVMDSPIFLYAESLGASATVMGLIAGLTPLMVIFQIPAADHVNQFGFKRFITTGWAIRLVFVLPLIAVPLMDGRINPQSQLAIVIGALFCFNLVRGIASTGWFPWITGLISKPVRGKYLTWENASNNIGSLVSLLLTAWYLGANPDSQQFAVLFAFSLLAGLVSLWFIHRVPDAPVSEENAGRIQPMPWKEILQHKRFRRLLRISFIWAVVMGGLMAFVVKFLKGPGAMPDDRVLYASAVKFVGGLATLWFLHSRLDRLGSRSLMVLAIVMWALIFGVWTGMSGGRLSVQFVWICGLTLVMGFAFCTFNMCLTKLAMAIVPERGKSHFFALYSVVGSLAVGVFPILWGILIDALEGVQVRWLGLEWNQFSIYFAALIAVLAGLLVLVLQLKEEHAADLNAMLRDFIRHNPLRDWMRR